MAPKAKKQKREKASSAADKDAGTSVTTATAPSEERPPADGERAKKSNRKRKSVGTDAVPNPKKAKKAQVDQESGGNKEAKDVDQEPENVKAEEAPTTPPAQKSRLPALETPSESSPKDDEADPPEEKETDAEDDESPAEDDSKPSAAKKTKQDEKPADEKLPRTIFVGNVPVATTRKDITKVFSKFGKVESVRFRSIAFATDKKPRKAAFALGEFNEQRDSFNAYVVFEKEEQAHAALAFHGHEIGGKHVRVDMAGSSTKKDPKRSVFVGNLTFTANEEAVRQFFSSCGEVDNVRLVRDKKTNLGKGFGYVLFRDVPSVRRALALHGSEFESRPLRVFRASENPNQTPVKTKRGAPKRGGGGSSYQGFRSDPKQSFKLRKTAKKGPAKGGPQKHKKKPTGKPKR